MERIQDISPIICHSSPMTRAALRPVTATAVWVLLLSLAALSQFPQSLVCSRSMTTELTSDGDNIHTRGAVDRLATSDEVIFGSNGHMM